MSFSANLTANGNCGNQLSLIFVRYGRIPCCWSKINNIRDRVVFPTLPNIAIG